MPLAAGSGYSDMIYWMDFRWVRDVFPQAIGGITEIECARAA